MIEEENTSVRMLDTLRTYTRMDDSEIKASVKERAGVLHHLASKNITGVDEVGRVILDYYDDPGALLRRIRK